MNVQLTRRSFLRAAAATLGLGALSACATPAGAPDSGDAGAAMMETVEIAWYEWGDVLDKDIADRSIADFQAENPHIQVRLEQAPGQYYDKLQAALAGGTAADIINNQTWLWQSFSAKGVYQPLNELQARDAYDTPFPAAWDSVYETQTRFRGELYGIPWNMNSMVIFYSKKPFDNMGLDYPTDDWTYEDFVQLTIDLTGEVDGQQQFGYQTNSSYERLACWMRLNGDKEWDQEIEPREALWDTPAIMDFINFQLYACINEFGVSPTPAMMEGGNNQIDSGNVAMKMEGPWFFPKMACREWSCTEEAMAENYVPFGVAQLPKASNGTRAHMVFGHVLLMNSRTEHPDETWEFLKFAGGEGAQKYVAQSGRQPVTPDFNERLWKPSTIEKWGLENPQPLIDAFESGILHLAGEVDDRYITAEAFGPARDRMVAGDADAFEVVPELNAKIQGLLDEYWASQG
jgi:multiple sugar transport system substrate-binding protein